MKIAILTSGILPVPAVQGGAVENLIDYYVDYNNRMGLHDITVFSVAPKGKRLPRQVGRTRYHYINTTSLWARVHRRLIRNRLAYGYYNYFITYFYERCLGRLLAGKFDVIVLENRPGYAIDLRRRTHAKLVAHVHLDSLEPNTYMSTDICNALDAAVGVSDYICRRIQSIGVQLPCYTVHNGIDLIHFNEATAARREDYGLAADDFVLIYIGRVSPIKGVTELVQAMRQMSHIKNLKLLVVGGNFFGNDHKGDLQFFNDLRREAEPLRDRIIFTGFQPYDRLPSLLKMADLAVLPSVCQEAFAMTVVEAMASGTPVVTTYSGGAPETCIGVARIVEQGPGLPDRLRMNIEDLYEHPEMLHQMSVAGTERSKQFSREQYAARFITTLEKLL